MSCLRRTDWLWPAPVKSSVSCPSPSRWLRSSLATWASWCPSRRPSRASRASLEVGSVEVMDFKLFLHCAPELLWLHLQFSCCLFVLVSPQVSTTLCPSRLSTWSAPSRKSFRRQRSWLRSTHKHPNNLNCCGEKRRGVLLVRSTSFVKLVKIQMYLSRHPERKFYLMFSMKDGIKHCLYTKQLVNCILPEGFKSCSW